MIETYTTQLVLKKQLTADVWHLRFSLLSPTSHSFIGGQYMILKIEGQGQRNYSIFSANTKKDSFELLVQIIPNGMASTYIANLVIGSKVTFQGPAGRFVLIPNNRSKLFLATGTGIAPMFSMLESHVRDSEVKDVPMHLFWGLKTKRDVYFIEKLQALEKEYPHFSYTICLSREEESIESMPNAQKGRINAHLLTHLDLVKSEIVSHENTRHINEYDYYICGGRDVVESVRQFVGGLGVIRENIYFEKF